MARSIPDWREASAYDYLHDLSPDELAWEWLRRNDSYRAAYRRLKRHHGMTGPEATEFAREWGLRFPGQSKPDGS